MLSQLKNRKNGIPMLRLDDPAIDKAVSVDVYVRPNVEVEQTNCALEPFGSAHEC